MEAKLFGLTLLFVVIGYTLGNVLFGILISKLKKVDLRKIGSGNVGATNTSRALGKKIGILVMLCDMFKGWLAVFVCSIIYQTLGFSIAGGNNDNFTRFGTLIYVSGFFAIVGHCFPIFYIYAIFKYKFDFTKAKSYSGGKGAATTAGVFAAISPWIFLTAFLVFMIIFLTFRYVSLASMIAISTVCLYPLIPRYDYFYMLNVININGQIIPSFPTVDQAYRVDNLINYTQNYEYIITICVIGFSIGMLIDYRHKDNIIRLITHTEKPLFEWKKNK